MLNLEGGAGPNDPWTIKTPERTSSSGGAPQGAHVTGCSELGAGIARFLRSVQPNLAEYVNEDMGQVDITALSKDAIWRC